MSPKYCYTCGHKLVVTRHVSCYDGATGKPKHYETYFCANQRWYHLDSHPKTSTEAYVYLG